VPAGFRRLALSTLQGIVHDLQAKRTGTQPGDPVVALAYSAKGTCLGAVSTLDAAAWAAGQPGPGPGRFVSINLCSYPSPIQHGEYRGRPSIEDVLVLAQRDAEELAHWYCDDTGRCWRADTPHPPELEDELAGAVALSAAAKRSIMRACRQRVDQLPPSLLGEHALIFDVDGTPFGSTYPLGEDYRDRALDTYVRVRVLSDDPAELEQIEQQLDRLRVCRSGRVVLT
jgi:hypothetical protein